MLGWDFHIYRQIGDKKTTPASVASEQGEHVASWEAHIGGLDWLEELVKQQKAICLQEGFYPGIFTAQIKDILPLLQNNPPGVREYWEWTGDEPKAHLILRKSKKALRSCLPDEWLVIEVWDES